MAHGSLDGIHKRLAAPSGLDREREGGGPVSAPLEAVSRIHFQCKQQDTQQCVAKSKILRTSMLVRV